MGQWSNYRAPIKYWHWKQQLSTFLFYNPFGTFVRDSYICAVWFFLWAISSILALQPASWLHYIDLFTLPHYLLVISSKLNPCLILFFHSTFALSHGSPGVDNADVWRLSPAFTWLCLNIFKHPIVECVWGKSALQVARNTRIVSVFSFIDLNTWNFNCIRWNIYWNYSLMYRAPTAETSAAALCWCFLTSLFSNMLPNGWQQRWLTC